VLADARLGGATVGSWAREISATPKPRGAVIPYGNAETFWLEPEQAGWE